jgi:hypothetical protein
MGRWPPTAPRPPTPTPPRAHVKRLALVGARSVKVYQQSQRERRQWYVEACRAEKVLCVPEGGGDTWQDLGMVVDGFHAVEHSLPETPAVRGRAAAVGRGREGRRRVRHVPHAHAAGGVRRPVGQVVRVPAEQPAERRAAAPALPGPGAGRDGVAAADVGAARRLAVPVDGPRRGGAPARRRARHAGGPRRAAGAGCALGAVGARRPRRDDPPTTRCARRRWRALATSASTASSGRWRWASSRTC